MTTAKIRAARIALETVAEDMDAHAGRACWCDEPSPGESGVIKCTPCAIRLWREVLLAALKDLPR